MNKFKYKVGVLGGTFDNLHKGHEFFIKNSFDKAEKIIIGLTSDSFLKGKKLSQNIQSFDLRKRKLTNFLEENNFSKRYEIIKIEDIYGITLKQKRIDVIFVTHDTRDNAKKINTEREKINLPKLEIVEVKLRMDGLSKPISSTNIRIGSINDFGQYYESLFETKLKFILDNRYREDFKKPIGKIIKEINPEDFKDKFIIAVGDVAVAMLFEKNIKPDISVFDLITKREKVSEAVLKSLPKPNILLENQQGTINSKTSLKIGDLIKKSLETKEPLSIKIHGEEDLLTIPAILFAPIGAVIFYGQRNVGGILVNATLDKKKEVETFLSKFN